METSPTSIAVLIPTYGRPELVVKAVRAVVAQMEPGDACVVVVRPDDELTHDSLATVVSPRLEIVLVGTPGIGAAVDAGLTRIDADVVAILDDDALPSPDWVTRIREAFHAEALLGAIGGPILNYSDVRTSNSFLSAGPVARRSPYGRLTSRTHGVPGTRWRVEVDFLPGSNMAFRRPLVSIPRHFRAGRSAGYELDLALQVQKAGHLVVYDSDLRVEHHSGRLATAPLDRDQEAYELLFGILSVYRTRLTGLERLQSIANWCLLGTRLCPGWLLASLAVVKGRPFRRRWSVCRQAEWDALVKQRHRLDEALS